MAITNIDFISYAQKRTVSLFIGAGVSTEYPTNLPLANSLANKLISSLCQGYFISEKEEEILNELVGTIRLEVLFSTLYQILGDDLIVSIIPFGLALPNYNHYAVAILAKHGKLASIFTTNFDKAIEKALDENQVPYQVFVNEQDYKKFPDIGSTLPVYKLHGGFSIGEPSHDDVVVLMEDAGKPLSPAKLTVFEHMLKTTDFIFLGYSGRDDFDIYPILYNINTERGLLWVSHVSDKNTFKEINGIEARKKQNGDHINKLVGKRGENAIRMYYHTGKYLSTFADLTTFSQFSLKYKKVQEINNVVEHTKSVWDRNIADWASKYKDTAIPYLVKGMVLGKEFANTFLASSNFATARDIALKSGDRRHYIQSLILLSIHQMDRGELVEAKANASLAFEKAKREGWTDLIYKAGNELGLVFAEDGENQMAIQIFEQTLNLLSDIQGSQEKGILFNNIGLAYWQMESLSDTIRSWEMALKHLKECGDVRRQVHILYNLALAHGHSGNTVMAIDYSVEGLLIESKVYSRGSTSHHKAVGLLVGLLQQTEKGAQKRNKVIEVLIDNGLYDVAEFLKSN